MGGYSGGIINFVGILRSAVFIYKEKNPKLNSPFVYAAFMVVYVAIGILTWNGWMSLLPTLGVLIFCTALWFGNPTLIRIFGIISSALWLTYDIILLSYVEIITESIMLISTIAALFYIDIFKKKKILGKGVESVDNV